MPVQSRKTRKQSKKPNSMKSAKSSRKTMSVTDIRNRFKEMDENIRSYLKKNSSRNPSSLGKHVSRQWTILFKKPLSSRAATSLAQHYLNLHAKKGGVFTGAPLDTTMRPGLPAIAAYATFPTEVGSDPKAVQDMDVYYNNALGRADIGSNRVPLPATGPMAAKVGGSRKKRMTRKRGGDFATALAARSYVANNPAGSTQIMSEKWMGKPVNVHDIADPTTYGWGLTGAVAPLGAPIPAAIRSTMDLSNFSPYPQASAVTYS